MNRWTVVPLERDLGSHAEAWDELNRAKFGAHPLLSSLFVGGLLRYFGDGSEHLCLLQEGAVIRAMCIVRPRNRLVWTSFTPAQGQVSATLVPNADMLVSLPESLPGMVLQLDLLCNDPLVGGVLDSTAPPLHRVAHALTMHISLAGNFGSYWAARPRNLPSNMRRYERRLQADGLTPRLVRVTEPGAIGAAVERYAALEGSGWKGRQGTALASTSEQYAFYLQLLLSAAERGDAIVYELWLNDKLAASRMALCGNGMLVMLKTSYDESLGQYAPGRLLLRAAIESAFASHSGGTIEFYTDASSDQLEWATGQRWIQHASLYRNRGASLAIQALKACSRWRATPPAPGTAELAVYTHPDALPADARQFMERAEARNIEFGWAWYRNLVEAVYRDHTGIRFYTLRQNGKVAAVLPLRAERGRFGWRVHSLSNFYTTLYEPALAPALKAADLLPLLQAVRQDFPRVAALMLAPMAPASHAHLVLLDALRMNSWFPFEFFAFGNWYQPVHSGWADYLAAREGSLRSTIKRMGKKFAAEGGVLEVITRPQDMPQAIAAYEEVYAASWKKREPFPAFMPGLLRACADTGVLRLGLARLHGRPVAAQAWIVVDGRAEIYKLAYDQEFMAYAPGTLVTAMLMQHVIEIDQVAEVDYLVGDDPYKKTWMSERRERWGIVAYNLHSAPGLGALAGEALRRTIKFLTQHLRRRPAAPPGHAQPQAPAQAN
jgi:CelD/BcsL family acetyltransferase involved in cellulose biosynthesis